MSEYKDLTGDPVYDHMKKHLVPGTELAGALIEEPLVLANKVGNNEARKKITFKYLDENKESHFFTYNYKKIESELRRQDLRGTID